MYVLGTAVHWVCSVAGVTKMNQDASLSMSGTPAQASRCLVCEIVPTCIYLFAGHLHACMPFVCVRALVCFRVVVMPPN